MEQIPIIQSKVFFASVLAWSAIAVLTSGLVFICYFFRPTLNSIPMEFTKISFIRQGLMRYGEKHDGLFPAGESATEVFQQLINDHDAEPEDFWFKMPGKEVAMGTKLSPKNVCFDFTYGSGLKSPAWIPIVYPTGLVMDFKSGRAAKQTSFSDTGEFSIAFIGGFRKYSFRYLGFPISSISLTPVQHRSEETTLYHQLTPEGGIGQGM